VGFVDTRLSVEWDDLVGGWNDLPGGWRDLVGG
jgi:hypothetical protein